MEISHLHQRIPVIVWALVWSTSLLAQEQLLLRLYAVDIEGRPVEGIQLTPTGGGSTSPVTTASGKTRLALEPRWSVGESVSLGLEPPADEEWVLVDYQAIVLAEDEPEPVRIVLMQRSDFRRLAFGALDEVSQRQISSKELGKATRQGVITDYAAEQGLSLEQFEQAITSFHEKKLDRFDRGLADLLRGEYQPAEESLAHSYELRKAQWEREATDAKVAAGKVVEAARYLGQAYYAQGKYREASEACLQALDLAPGDPDLMNALGMSLSASGRLSEAEDHLVRTLEIRERELHKGHPAVARSLNNLALLYHAQARYALAEPLFQRSLDVLERALGPNHSDVAGSLHNLANLYRSQGRFAAAEALFRRSLAITEQALGRFHPGLAGTLQSLANLYRSQERFAEAEPLYQRSLRIMEQRVGLNHPDFATTLNNLALFYDDQRRYADAEGLYQRSLEITEKALGPDHPYLATSLHNLGSLYLDQGRYADAESLLQRSLTITEQSLGLDHPEVARTLASLANLHYEQERYVDVEPLYQRALAIKEQVLGPDHPALATTLNNLALFFSEHGDPAEAESMYQRSLAISEKALGPEHPDVASRLVNYSIFLSDLGRKKEARMLGAKAREIRIKHAARETAAAGPTLP